MKYILKAYCISEFGQRVDAEGRPHQEDSVYPAVGHLTDNARTFILCDGMGGHEAGEVASATVCETMGKIISEEDSTDNGVFTTEDFERALAGAYDALDEKDNGSPKKMGTTMTFLKLHENGATIAHIGDSRVYHIRPGQDGEDTKILFETQDHSLINDLIKVGELTKEEAHFSTQKNVITRAMQPNMDRRPNADIHQITDIKDGDYFYMCSDGMLEEPEMDNGESLRNIFSEKGGDDANKVQILRTVTEDNRDNHTAFIIHILKVEGTAPQISAPIQATYESKTHPVAATNPQATPAPVANKPAATAKPAVVAKPAATAKPAGAAKPSATPHADTSRHNEDTIPPKGQVERRKQSSKGLNRFVVIAACIATIVVLCYFFKHTDDSRPAEYPPEPPTVSTANPNEDNEGNRQRALEAAKHRIPTVDENSAAKPNRTVIVNPSQRHHVSPNLSTHPSNAEPATTSATTVTQDNVTPNKDTENAQAVQAAQNKQNQKEEIVIPSSEESKTTKQK